VIVSVSELRKDIEQRIAQLWLDVQKIAPADYPAGPELFQVGTGGMDGVTLTLQVCRNGHNPHDLRTPDGHRIPAQEQRVYYIVKAAIQREGRRIIGSEVKTAMKAAGWGWGISTVANMLSRLVDAGFLVNDNDKRGYGLPGDDW
jgi:hypothetical protein